MWIEILQWLINFLMLRVLITANYFQRKTFCPPKHVFIFLARPHLITPWQNIIQAWPLWPGPAASPRTSAASPHWRGPRSPAAAPSAGSPRWSRHTRPRFPPAWRYQWRSRNTRELSSFNNVKIYFTVEMLMNSIALNYHCLLVGIFDLSEGCIFVGS